MKFGNDLSKYIIIKNTGAPQGCVLASPLFTLYTNDYTSKYRACTIIIKYAEDIVIIGKTTDNDESMCREEVKKHVELRNKNFNLNANKTKKVIVDFRRNCAHTDIKYKLEMTKWKPYTPVSYETKWQFTCSPCEY